MAWWGIGKSGGASDGWNPRLRSVAFEGMGVGIEWAGRVPGLCSGRVGYLPPLYRNHFIWFNSLDLGDPLHASTVALHDLPDPFRFYTPRWEPSHPTRANSNVHIRPYSPNSTGECGRASNYQ